MYSCKMSNLEIVDIKPKNRRLQTSSYSMLNLKAWHMKLNGDMSNINTSKPNCDMSNLEA